MGSVIVNYDRRRLIELLQRDALKRGTFTLASGRTSHYYVDGRKLTLSAEGAVLIGAGVLEQLRSYPQVKAVGGLTLGADPIVGRHAGAGVRRRPEPSPRFPGAKGSQGPRHGEPRRGPTRERLHGGDRR